ncbi:MAG: alpha/beta hydrolase fold protein [Frankiales bacterium]|jgi:pimeloyl-ACP methyl ester carboxylesterase|nr:alpha/beta hydrolase fold protein [Frankiales bacterium]
MQTVVRTRDGVDLHVEVDEGPDPTVVLVHGFTARLEEFLLQRETLRGRARTVLYDCRGHGRSRGQGKVQGATIDQLGRDLGEVLDAVAPRGPVVLLGHSMGGMTIMALARQRPELFGERVVGTFLLATSSGGLVEAGPLGMVVRIARRLGLLQLFLWLAMLWSPVLERFRKRGTRLGARFYRQYLFGSDDAQPELVRLVQDLLEETPLTVTSAFYSTLLDHDEHASLAAMRDIPVTLLVGDADRLTPASHSRRMADALPDAELTVVPGAGHSVNITRQDVVDAALLRLLDRVEQQRAA